MYYRLKETHSISYLNGKEYINNKLMTLGSYIKTISLYITNNQECGLNNPMRYKTMNEEMRQNMCNKINELEDIPIMDMGKPHSKPMRNLF